MAPQTKKPSKPIFKTSSPFTETKWPIVSLEDQEIITKLTCKYDLTTFAMFELRRLYQSLVAPIGEHRKTHIHPSKGRKRKRDLNAAPDEPSVLPVPATASHVLVGLNSVTRHLEIQAASTAPPTVPIGKTTIDEQENPTQIGDKGSATPLRILSIVILTHPQPSLSPSHAHIPTLLHLANLRRDPGTILSEPTRLVCLATSNDAQLASALHIPRVGAIGILEGAPGAKALEEYVRKHVDLTECAWVDEVLRSEWQGLNVQQG